MVFRRLRAADIVILGYLIDSNIVYWQDAMTKKPSKLSRKVVGLTRSQYQNNILLASVFFFAAFGAARGDDFGAKIEAACPAAVAERARLLSARPMPKEVTIVSRPALRNELLEMDKQDQDARELLIAVMATGDLPEDHPARLRALEVDAYNLRLLKHIIEQDGFPTTKMVGVDGVRAAFTLTQHADADPQFQAKILYVATPRLKEGEIEGQEYALLTDRVLRAQGKPQRYGSQFGGSEEGMKPDPIADEAHVDERRNALGMVSLANYSCVLHAMYAPPQPTSSH
jgi:hypothetical protein